MKSRVLKACVMVMMAAGIISNGATVAHWDFEDGVAGESFTPAGQPNGSGGSLDLVRGITMHGWNEQYGPSWSSYTPDGSSLSSRNNYQDGYTTDAQIAAWSPSTWTIETAVYMYDMTGYKTIIGRDGSSQGEAESDFYLQRHDISKSFRVNFDTVGGQRWVLDSSLSPIASRWYGLAVTSDGQTVTMYIDMGDGNGYSSVGSLDISAQSVADNALAANTYNWTFGRGWYNGSFVDQIDGYLDNVRFSDTALAPEELIGITVPEPATMVLLGLGALVGIRKRK